MNKSSITSIFVIDQAVTICRSDGGYRTYPIHTEARRKRIERLTAAVLRRGEHYATATKTKRAIH